MALQEILTRFGFQFDGQKLAAVERGVKRASTNLNTIAHNADLFQQRMGGFLARAKGLIGAYLGFRVVRSITTDYATAADTVAKFATATGIATDQYQGLVHAVKIGGTDQENLNKALTRLSKRALEAGQGLTTNQRAFRELGIEWNDTEGKLKSGDQLFLEMADGLVNLEDKEKRTGLAMQLLGRSGATLLPTMLEGSKGIRRLIEDAKKLGLVLTGDQLKAAEQFNDEMLRTKSVLTGVRNQIAAKLLPAITKQLRAFQEWAKRGDNLKRALERLRIIAKAVGIVLAVMITGKAVKAFQTFTLAVRIAVQWVKGLGIASTLARLKVMALYASLILIPLLIEDLIFFAQGKDSLIGRFLGDSKLAKELKSALLGIGKELKATWKELKPVLLEAWVALKPVIVELWKAIRPIIGPALKAGVWLLIKALQVLTITIRAVTWIVKETVKGFQQWGHVSDLVAKAMDGDWTPLLANMKTDWENLKKAARDAWDDIAARSKVTWGDIKKSASDGGNWVERAWDDIAARSKVTWGDIKKSAGDAADWAGKTWSDAARWVDRAWENPLKTIQSGLDSILSTLEDTLTLKGLLEDKPITWLDDVRGAIRLQETFAGGLDRAVTAGTAPLNPFAPLPGAGAPLPALPGIGALPGVGGPGGIQATANVAPGAIQISIRAEGDAAQIAAKVNEVVTAKINEAFTSASRDLVKPPPGQR